VDTKTVKPLSEQRVLTVRQDLLDSLIAKPKQTSAEMAEVTRKIASKRKLTVQQVAGVRAAMSRGSYGTIRTLLKNRRKATS
jgi:hypothetical protein